MAPYDSAYLLAMFNRRAGRAASDTITDDTKYLWLSEAQDEVVSEIATVSPYALYPKVGTLDLPTLSTTDGNVWTFGTDDNGYPIAPIGRTQIYPDVGSIPNNPWRENVDYLAEGNQIRLPQNRAYGGPLYWRGVVMPPPITALVLPALIPEQANELTVIRAVRNFAESGNLRNAPLADRMNVRWGQRFPHWCLVWKTQFRSGGALVSFRRGGGGGGPLGDFLIDADGGFLVGGDGSFTLI